MKKKKVRKFIFVCLKKGMLISLIVSLFVFVPALTKLNNVREDAFSRKFVGKKAEYQGVIRMWNIDTFESGSISKTSFLENVSLKFEKENKGAYIKVENLTIDEFLCLIKENKKPDLFSFGTGVQNYLKDYFQVLPNESIKSVKTNFLACGVDGENIKAVPWSYNSYVLISSLTRIEKAGKSYKNNLKEISLDLDYDKKYKKNTKHVYSLTFGGNNYVNAVNVFNREFDKNIINEVSLQKIDKNYDKNTFYNAYVDFINNNASVLLGTNRDVFRMENRVFAGKEKDVIYQQLKNYTDLVNYMSVLTTETKKKNLCFDFIKFLLSENTQKQIKNMGLYSTTINNLYDDGVLKLLESELTENLVVKNLF